MPSMRLEEDPLRLLCCGVVFMAGALFALGCGPKSARESWAGELKSPVWRTWEKANSEPFRSVGHTADRFLVDVYVNKVGFDAFMAKKGPYPVGTVIVKAHFPDEDGRPGSESLLTSMEKREPGYDDVHADWEYGKAVPGGEMELRGPHELCWSCHITANTLNPSADYVFGLP